ncbi:MAG TPA: thiamine phosphate synthase [Gemmatimonadales bacterium]|nr:thiamine phosphate synthase [Gemmatimonadales bacterium]
MNDNLAAQLRLMLVTDDRLLAGRDLLGICHAAVQGGVTCVQLRLKLKSPRELIEAARVLIGGLPVPVLINDRLDVALAAGAAGVHLGPDDLPVALAREIVPAGFLIGASVGNHGEAELGQAADYWGIGPWRATSTKPDAGAPLGPAGFRDLCSTGRGIPCVAIGGIRPEDVPAVFGAGGSGVAVVSGILGAADVRDAASGYAVASRLPE